jgi:hypothetical protein
MKTILIIAVFLTLVATQAQGDMLVNSETTFNYAYLSTDLWNGITWASDANYSSSDWNTVGWNSTALPFYWPANNDAALSKTVTVNGIVTSATYSVAVDNGFILFVNGKEVIRRNDEGSPIWWEYSGSINPSFFHPGENAIQVLLEDHGGGTGFDMRIEANVSAVPIPAAILLFVPGLAGLAAARRRFKK